MINGTPLETHSLRDLVETFGRVNEGSRSVEAQL